MSSPLCGKHSSIKNYETDHWEDDVELISYIGLGRGAGFEKVVEGYLDDDPDLKAMLLKRVNEVKKFLEAE